MAGTLPPILVELKANSSEFMTRMGEARHEVSKLGTESAGHMQKFAAVGKAALLGVAGAAVVVGGYSVEMADKFERSHAKLVAAVKATGSSMDVWGSQISNTNKYMEKLGFTNAESEDALGQLTIALGDPSKAMQVMSTSADLARAKNIDLASAGVMVARAMEGNSRALKQMGIDLPINAKSAENLKVAQNNLRFATEAYKSQLERVHEKHTVTKADLDTLKTAHDRLQFAQSQVNEAQHAGTLILDELNKRLGGQSQEYTESFAGKVTVLKAQLEDLGVKIGLAVIPMLEKAATVTEDVVNWFEKHRTIAMALGIVVGGVLVTAIGAYVVSMVAAAAATIAATWPILAIIAAVAAVGVGIALLATHWSTVWGGIKSVTETVFGAIRTAAEDVAHFFSGAFTAAVNGIVGVFKDVAKYIFDVWGSVVGFLIDGAAKAFGWVPGLGGKLKHAAKAFDQFRDDVNAALAGVHTDITLHVDAQLSAAANTALHAIAPTTVGHAYAKGTDYAPGGMALVGERGPELVNLPRGSKVYPNGTGPGGGGGDVYVTIETAYGDPETFARSIRDALLRIQGRTGSLGFA
jgi:hypothetical protein